MAAKRRQYTFEELWNPQIDLKSDACAYGRQSTKEQIVSNVQSHISQTVGLLQHAKELGFRDDGSTGAVTLFIENQVVDGDGNIQIKNASGTWPIDKRPGLKTILDLIESGKVKLIIVEFVDRLFRDEDRIDSNIFIKVCKEHDCYVYITSKRMTYNFTNPQMAEMFRQEVAFAAAYIQHHVKDVMIRRRDMAVSKGQYGGGYVAMGFIICKEKGPKYNRYVPYEPHAEIIKNLAQEFIECGCNIGELYRKKRNGVFFPDFETGVLDTGLRSATKVDGGYLVKSREGILSLLTNPANIGIIEYGDIFVEEAHDKVLDKAIYYLIRSKLKESAEKFSRNYYQKNSSVERKGTLKGLISTKANHYCAYLQAKNEYYYRIYKSGIVLDEMVCLPASYFEGLIEGRLLTKIQASDLGSFEEELKERRQRKIKRLKDINMRIEIIDEELDSLAENLTKIQLDSLIRRLEVKAEKISKEKEALEKEYEEGTSIEKELAGLTPEAYIKKTFNTRKRLLDFLIRTIWVEQMSSSFFKITVEWKVPEWGAEFIYIDRSKCRSKRWTDDETTTLIILYPNTDKMEILKSIPNRSWLAITRQALNMKIKRHEPRQLLKINPNLSWSDLQFLDSIGETIDTLPFEKWECVPARRDYSQYNLRERPGGYTSCQEIP